MTSDKKNISACTKKTIFDKINEVINVNDKVNFVKIDCAHELLRWSSAPDICRKRHNVILSSLGEARIVKKVSRITLIPTEISENEFIKKITELCLKVESIVLKPRNLVILRDDDVSFYVELLSLKGNIGKYRSNKKKRLMTRLGLLNDYELTLFFNLLFSLPYFILRVLFLNKNKTGAESETTPVNLCDKLRCKSMNMWVSKNSFLLCTHER